MKRHTHGFPFSGVFLILAAFLSLGWADTFEGIRAAAGSIQSISADFKQEKEMRILVRPLVSHGRFYYQKPGSLRWEYRSPIESVLLMHNGDTRRYLRSDREWISDTAADLQSMDFVLQEITQWLNGRFDQNPMFEAVLAPGKKIVLTPRSEALTRIIQRIELVMADQAGVLKEVVIIEGSDSLTRLTFTHPQVNRPIAETVFQGVQ